MKIAPTVAPATSQLISSVGLATSRKYPAVMTPGMDLASLLTAVNEIKEVVEILIRVRGKVDDSAFTVADADKIFTRIARDYATKAELVAAKGDRLLGLYDQVADVASNTGAALLPADAQGMAQRDYYILEVNGDFTSVHPDLAGKTGGPGDEIIVANGVWNLVTVSTDYLSSVIDDTADGHITLAKIPTASGHAAQLQQVITAEAAARDYADQQDALRMLWKGPWQEQTYYANEVVLDRAWLMIANKETDERAAPTPQGDPFWYSGEGDSPAWTGNQVSATEVITGTQYTVGDSGYITGWRIWAPVAAPNMRYTVAIIRNYGTALETTNIQGTFSPTVTGWLTVTTGYALVLPGEVIHLILLTVNTSTQSSWFGDWNYVVPNNDIPPPPGDIVHANKNMDTLRISKTDSNTGDRAAELLTVHSGDTIIGAGMTWTVTSVNDLALEVEFGITPEAQGIAGVHNFEFVVHTAQPIDYVEIPLHYAGNPNVVSFFSTTGLAGIAFDEKLYGVDLEVQGAVVSEDWDAMAFSG